MRYHARHGRSRTLHQQRGESSHRTEARRCGDPLAGQERGGVVEDPPDQLCRSQLPGQAPGRDLRRAVSVHRERNDVSVVGGPGHAWQRRGLPDQKHGHSHGDAVHGGSGRDTHRATDALRG